MVQLFIIILSVRRMFITVCSYRLCCVTDRIAYSTVDATANSRSAHRSAHRSVSAVLPSIEYAFFNGIELIQVAFSSLPCTLSLYNAFMWTVSVKAGQSELNEARVTNEQTKERTNTSRDFLKCIYTCRYYIQIGAAFSAALML